MSTTDNPQQGSDDEVLTPTEAADLLRVTIRTLDAWRYRRVGPAYSKIGRHVRYRRSELLRFVADAEVAAS